MKQHVGGPTRFHNWVVDQVDKLDTDWLDEQWKNISGDIWNKMRAPAEWLGAHAANFAGWTFTWLSGFAWLALLPLTLWYSLMDYDAFHRRAFWLVPPGNRAVVRELAMSINHALGSYLRGYAVLCLGVGVAQTTALLVLAQCFSFRYALLVGLYSGLTYFIPYLGSLSTTILAGLAIFFTGGGSLTHTLIGVGVVQGINTFTDSVVTPKIIGDNTGLHPLLVMFALLAGGKLAGLVGVIISTPALVCLKIILDHFIPRLSGPIPAAVSAMADTVTADAESAAMTAEKSAAADAAEADNAAADSAAADAAQPDASEGTHEPS